MNVESVLDPLIKAWQDLQNPKNCSPYPRHLQRLCDPSVPRHARIARSSWREAGCPQEQSLSGMGMYILHRRNGWCKTCDHSSSTNRSEPSS